VSVPLRTHSGASFNFKDFVEGRVDFLEDPEVSSIRKYAFYEYTNLRTISFPNCDIINQDAFTNCINLSTLYLPEWPSPES
jgi:hypothetical protein